jgi:acyl-CoA dehydrogenase
MNDDGGWVRVPSLRAGPLSTRSPPCSLVRSVAKMSQLVNLLGELAAAPVQERALESLDAWWARHRDLAERFELPVDRAIAGGFVADRLGYAFASGYREALVSLVPSLAGEGVLGLAATEEGGVKPSAIRAQLVPASDGSFVLNGSKRWATLAPRADLLLIVACAGTDQGRNRLVVVRVPARRAGIVVRALPPTPFAPEIPHAEIDLIDVSIAASEILEGDGWDAYLKPFRTIEDIHVHAALLGHLVAVSRRRSFPRELVEELLAAITALRALALDDPSSPAIHLALAGMIEAAGRTIARMEPHWSHATDEERVRWERDRALLSVAGKARESRRDVAWQRVAP